MGDRFNKRPKVFGGMTLVAGQRRQVRTIVAASSQRRAAELLGVSMFEIRHYWSVTGNAAEIAAASARPGVVLYELEPGEFTLGPVTDISVLILNVIRASPRGRMTATQLSAATKLSPGALYPTLARLEADGRLASELVGIGCTHPRTRLYHLTEKVR